MNSTALDTLAGRLSLFPGRPLPTVQRHRPRGIERLFRGQPAEALPGLLASVYTLCGHAHRLTARRAISAAQGVVTTLAPEDIQSLQRHTVREHARRITLDWPVLAGLRSVDTMPVFQRCPAVASLSAAAAPHTDDMNAWLHADVLGMPPPAWRSAVRREGAAWLQNWCETTDTPAARSLRVAASQARHIAIATCPLRLQDDPIAQHALAAALAASASFIDAPQSHGSCAETGPWTRAHDPATGTHQNAWMRLAARLADLVHLCAPEGSAWLSHGALNTGPNEGLAWTETARGLLVHWLRLDGARVADGRVLAPTDWNFHPRGVVAQALTQLPLGDETQGPTRWLVAAFDPCVAHECVLPHEDEAACA
jgi:Nickel-dependent hydrogenase